MPGAGRPVEISVAWRHRVGRGGVLARVAALLVSCVLVSASALAQDGPAAEPTAVSVRIGAEPLGSVPPLATAGFNYGNAMQVVGYEDRFDAIRVQALRFPPGNQADEIVLGRPDLDLLAINLGLLGNPPVMMVANLFGGTPEQAAELARLARELGIDVSAWEIGNEPDLYAQNRNGPSWTPAKYCERFRAYADAIRTVEPDAVFAGPAVSGARPSGASYLRDVIAACGDAIDILTWHIYPTDGTWDDAAALATSGYFAEEFSRFRAWAADPTVNPLGHDRNHAFGVTEFGLSWRSPAYRHLEDMTATLWLADVLGQMTRERLDMSHYFTLQGMGGHGLIDVGGWVRPTYWLYEMLADFVGEALPAEADAPLRAYAVRGDSAVEILLVNRSTEALAADVTLPAGAAGSLEARTLTEAGFDATGEPDRATLAAGAPVPVPARSIVVLRLPFPAY